MSSTLADTILEQIDALNRHDVAAFVGCYSPDAAVFDPQYPDLLRGRDAIAKDMSDFLAAFPDLAGRITRAVREGDTWAYEMAMTGTHTGPLPLPTGEVPATNKRIEVGGAIFARVDAQGRITEERRYYDLAGLLGQLGLLQ